MDKNFWLQKWEKNEIAFHENTANPTLVKYFSTLNLNKGDRICVPLCGKTLDIAWFLSKDYRVVGAELSKTAIEQLFSNLGAKPKITIEGDHQHYSAENIDIFVGDIFQLSKEKMGTVNAIYDRAALVALPHDMRRRYSHHLREITNTAPQLLITYDYDQTKMEGPPFSVSPLEVQDHYKKHYTLTHLSTTNIPNGIRGTETKEDVWVLRKKS